MAGNMSIALYALPMRMLTSLLVDEILLPMYKSSLLYVYIYKNDTDEM